MEETKQTVQEVVGWLGPNSHDDGLIVEELEQANERIKSLVSENARLNGLFTILKTEAGLLRMSLAKAQEQLALRDEEWARPIAAPASWIVFRRKCLDHVQELMAEIRDLKRQVEEERSNRVWHAKHATETSRSAELAKWRDVAAQWERLYKQAVEELRARVAEIAEVPENRP
jgi:sugar/nucleoside kinase (ribokinase family)